MKNKFKSLLLLFVIFLTFGCMDYNLNMEISKDKQVDFKVSASIDLLKYLLNYGNYLSETCTSACNNDQDCLNECSQNQIPSNEEDLKSYIRENITQQDFNEFLSEEESQELKDKGFNVDLNYDKENLKYEINVSKKYDNIDTLTSINEQEININDLTTNEIFYTKKDDVYIANYFVDNSTDGLDLNMDLDELKELITMNYVVTLPNKPIKHNATTTSKDGKILTWDLMQTNKINYEFTFTTENSTENKDDSSTPKENILNNKYFAYGLIGVGAIVLIIGLAGLVKANKRG